MAHGPKCMQRRSRRMRDANRLAQAVGYNGARDLMQRHPPLYTSRAWDAACAAIAAGYGSWQRRKAY
jgi:hypothetical protein